MRIPFFAVSIAALLAAPAARAQLPPKPQPAPTLPSGPGDPGVNRPKPTPPVVDPCQDFSNQPLLTLTLAPEPIYREDAITATWEVRDRRPGVAWAHPAQIEAAYASPGFPSPLPLRGTHRFTTNHVSGHLTLKTRCGEKRVSWERIPDAFLESVDPGRGGVGAEVTLQGSQFGAERLGSRVEIIADGQTHGMEIVHWGGNTSVRVKVPVVPAGNASIRLMKGGRRPTLARPFRVVKSVTVDSAFAALAISSMGFAPGFVHLDAGPGASSVTLPAGLGPALGIPATFTVVAFEVNVPRGEQIVQTALLPVTGFPEKVRYEVNNVNSNALTASVSGGQLVLGLTFESAGSEIKGRVRYCEVGGFGECARARWKDSLAPDIQVDNLRFTLRLTPAASNGSLAFPAGQGVVDADVQIGSDFANWIVPGLRTFTNDVKQAARDGVAARLNAQGTRDAIAAAFMGRLRALDPALHAVVAVTPHGNSILIEYD